MELRKSLNEPSEFRLSASMLNASEMRFLETLSDETSSFEGEREKQYKPSRDMNDVNLVTTGFDGGK